MPTVICEDWPAGNSDYDPNFVSNIPPEVKIVRVRNAGPQTSLQKFFRRKLLPYLQPARAPYLWWQAARAQIRELTQRTKFDAIWATSDPLVTLDLGAETASILNVPWIADIRDSYNVQAFGSWYKRPIWARQERKLCQRAQAVVTVSQGLANGLIAATGKPVEVIENGFDPELFEGPPAAPCTKFSIAYTGNLAFPLQDPKLFLQAVDECLRIGAIPRGEIELLFYGPSKEQIEAALPGALNSLPIRICPKVSHQEIVLVQQASSVLLLLTMPGRRGVLTGKFFDYLAAGRPILAVPGDDADVADVLRRTGAGVPAGTVEEITRVLKDWFGEWKSKGAISLPRDEAAINHYSRRAQTKRLATILDRLTAT